jgi:sugar transferase (PEP-CTERM system associated)
MRPERNIEQGIKPTIQEPELSVLGGYAKITSIVKEEHVHRIIVALDERRGNFPVEQLLFCRLKGVRVDDGMAFTEDLAGKLSVENLHPSSLIFSNGFRRSSFFRKAKRCVDVLVSLLGLVLSGPLTLAVALAIRLESKGPVLYRQERVGEDGKVFSLLKFRSMGVDAEQNGPVWAGKNDNRVTRVGKIIRKLRLDEIPQMINVLRGEMSFVGPRPERPFFVERLKREIPYYSQRHTLKPGITGWAQVRYPYGASKEDALEKLKFDLYYVKHMSIFFDLMIVLETIKTVLFSKGAR